MITRGIREFVSRDWPAAREAKDAYWGERIARLGPVEGWRIADQLRRQALLQNPAWPSPADRQQDILFHAHLSQLFQSAGSARRP